MAGEGGEKTEKASPKKREDERKKGNIFMSKDVTTVISLVVAFYVIQAFVGNIIARLQSAYLLQNDRAVEITTLTKGNLMQMLRESMAFYAITILPVMIIIAVVSIVVSVIQTRGLVSYDQIKFKMERISFLKGVKRLFSIRSIVELLKSLIKITLLIVLLYGKVKAAINYLPLIIDWDISQAAAFTGNQIMSLIVSVAIAFGAVAAADFFYQWWEYEKGIRMSKQEMKDEYKQMEGNPQVKGARRQKQRELAMSRMMQQVPDADVIVRNPTHFAVALKYKLDVDLAPIVVAKGQDLIALKIVSEGEKHGIVTVENKPLARGLYELSEVNSVIPNEFYQPVAELLAWIYSTKEKDKPK